MHFDKDTYSNFPEIQMESGIFYKKYEIEFFTMLSFSFEISST